MKRFAHDKNIKLSLLTSKMKALFHEGNMKVFRPGGRRPHGRGVWRLNSEVSAMVFPSWFTSGKLSAVCAGRPVWLSSLSLRPRRWAPRPPGTLGEPTAAQDSAVTAVVATSFGAAGAQVRAWTKPAQAPSRTAAGPILPAGVGTRYEAAPAGGAGGA